MWTVGCRSRRSIQIKSRIVADPAEQATTVHGSIDCTMSKETARFVADKEKTGKQFCALLLCRD